VVTSAKSIATSVMGFCRPVRTLASLMGIGSGRVVERTRMERILSTADDIDTRLL
jgi:hypothetical protein